jgi:hypothetical protein
MNNYDLLPFGRAYYRYVQRSNDVKEIRQVTRYMQEVWWRPDVLRLPLEDDAEFDAYYRAWKAGQKRPDVVESSGQLNTSSASAISGQGTL